MAAYNFISLGFRLICDINQTPDAIHASVSFASSVYLFFLVVALSVGRFYSPVSFATSLLFMAVLFNPAARAYAFWGLLLIGFYTLAATYTAWNDSLLNRAFTQYGQTRRRRPGLRTAQPLAPQATTRSLGAAELACIISRLLLAHNASHLEP